MCTRYYDGGVLAPSPAVRPDILHILDLDVFIAGIAGLPLQGLHRGRVQAVQETALGWQLLIQICTVSGDVSRRGRAPSTP